MRDDGLVAGGSEGSTASLGPDSSEGEDKSFSGRFSPLISFRRKDNKETVELDDEQLTLFSRNTPSLNQ